MKLTWNKNKSNNKKRSREAIASYPNLPFDQQDPLHDDMQLQNQEHAHSQHQDKPSADALDSDFKQLAQSFQAQGNKLAEDGKYREALGKWETALNLMPGNAVLLEQKAQAWITLGRSQLNFGEPDSAIESFGRALAIKPDSVEAQDDRKTASHLIKKRKQLHSLGLSTDKNRYMVGDSTESS
ncbi:tetratricopeptide repeat protein 33 isoform X1 [Gossypium australe]|uniref:Tetratricopeptide repeat protein 33 isoform X1 n=1 Tax=Gossypium australe TaxID=47621 RepID=A0A5B6U942_9ROSI|nr:tetratricopeptide repeat protein 33 isoform X1 [Gossypium australe]